MLHNPGLQAHVELWVQGAGEHNSVDLSSAQMLVARDSPSSVGVDVFTIRNSPPSCR